MKTQDKELVACIGRAMKFNFKNNQIIGKDVYSILKDHKLLDEDPMIRIKSILGILRFHSVCRSTFWKIAWKEAVLKNIIFMVSELF